MISYSIIGLTLVVLAWITQFFIMPKSKKISPFFILIYAIGVAFLVYDGFSSGLNNLAVMNLISLIVSLIVLIKVLMK
jgi:hypothetical protein